MKRIKRKENGEEAYLKKQKSQVGFGALLLCFLVLLSGCTNQISKTESIQDILTKAESINSVYYDIIINSSYTLPQQNASASMKVWDKYPYQKMEFTIGYMTSIMIIRPDGEYKYNSEISKYIKIKNISSNDNEIKSCKGLSRLLRNITRLEIIGTETIDGKETTIIEYTISMDPFTTYTYWIWNEKGIPLKEMQRTEIQNVTTTATMTYKNFSFEDIPDSVFDVTK